MKFLQALLVLLGLSLNTALPTKSEAEVKTLSFASEASQIIASNLLKSFNDIDGNQVHSPLGVTTMLAILAEGSQGDTYDEFYKVLGYPKERAGLRDSFKSILSKYQIKALGAEPSFQTWLYIYRNFSAKEEFKKMISDYYFVDVKDINREQFDWADRDQSSLLLELDNNSKDVIGFETLKRIKLDDDDLGVTTVGAYTDNYGEEVIEKETSKFDRVVDEKQYVEKPQIIEETKKAIDAQKEEQPEKDVEAAAQLKAEATQQPSVESTEKLENLDEKPVADIVALVSNNKNNDDDSKDQSKREDDLNLEENETVQENEKILKNYKADDDDNANNNDAAAASDDTDKYSIKTKAAVESNEPEKVTLPLQKLETVLDEATKGSPDEIMLALESHVSSARSLFGGRSLFRRDDITAALSANSITGRDINSKTKMLLFNGLYFRGNWATPFREERNTEEFFFMTSEDAMKAPMMHARGKFHIADMENLNAKIICLPYENQKYSMMIVLPNEMEGLHSVIDKMQPSDYKLARNQMKEQDLHIILPKFQIEETSHSESTLKSLGLTKLFSRSEADLSLLSDDNDLHIDEIVQFVNVRVDEGGNSAVGISALDTQARDTESYETIAINHPFLYFVMDCEEEFVLVSGKVHAPEVQEELPVTVEVEFDLA